MRVLLLGVSHHTAPLELRERLALTGDRIERLLAALGGLGAGRPVEAMALSTCNRTEVYVARASHQPPEFADLRRVLCEVCGIADGGIAEALFELEGPEAVSHLFRVCTGLDSMVLGEPQILGQVRRAYEQATRCRTVGPVLHQLVQSALAAAKDVRGQTALNRGHASVGSVAVDFARRVFDRFDDKIIVGIGAGPMGKLTLVHLRDLGPRRLWVVNRNPERAARVADQLRLTPPTGGARPWSELHELLVEADVVMTSTGSSQPILRAADLRAVRRRRRGRPLLIVDLAVPRDVEADAAEIDDVYLYNIDDLRKVLAQTDQHRARAADAADALLARRVTQCLNQIQHRHLGRLVKALRGRLHDIGRQERQRTLRKLQTARSPGELAEALDLHTHRLINKILHLPISQLDARRAETSLSFYAAALRRLFDLRDLDEAESRQPAAPSATGPLDAEPLDAEALDASAPTDRDDDDRDDADRDDAEAESTVAPTGSDGIDASDVPDRLPPQRQVH